MSVHSPIAGARGASMNGVDTGKVVENRLRDMRDGDILQSFLLENGGRVVVTCLAIYEFNSSGRISNRVPFSMIHKVEHSSSQGGGQSGLEPVTITLQGGHVVVLHLPVDCISQFLMTVTKQRDTPQHQRSHSASPRPAQRRSHSPGSSLAGVGDLSALRDAMRSLGDPNLARALSVSDANADKSLSYYTANTGALTPAGDNSVAAVPPGLAQRTQTIAADLLNLREVLLSQVDVLAHQVALLRDRCAALSDANTALRAERDVAQSQVVLAEAASKEAVAAAAVSEALGREAARLRAELDAARKAAAAAEQKLSQMEKSVAEREQVAVSRAVADAVARSVNASASGSGVTAGEVAALRQQVARLEALGDELSKREAAVAAREHMVAERERDSARRRSRSGSPRSPRDGENEEPAGHLAGAAKAERALMEAINEAQMLESGVGEQFWDEMQAAARRPEHGQKTTVAGNWGWGYGAATGHPPPPAAEEAAEGLLSSPQARSGSPLGRQLSLSRASNSRSSNPRVSAFRSAHGGSQTASQKRQSAGSGHPTAGELLAEPINERITATALTVLWGPRRSVAPTFVTCATSLLRVAAEGLLSAIPCAAVHVALGTTNLTVPKGSPSRSGSSGSIAEGCLANGCPITVVSATVDASGEIAVRSASLVLHGLLALAAGATTGVAPATVVVPLPGTGGLSGADYNAAQAALARCNTDDFLPKTAVACPIVFKHRVYGCVQLSERRKGSHASPRGKFPANFSPSEVQAVELVAAHLGAAIGETVCAQNTTFPYRAL